VAGDATVCPRRTADTFDSHTLRRMQPQFLIETLLEPAQDEAFSNSLSEDRMGLASAATPAPTSVAPPAGAYPPAGVFISYASEDFDIAEAVYQCMQSLGETVFDRIKIFFDRKTIDASDEIRTDLGENLEKSDFLIILYTGRLKVSHGWTGWELGFFQRLIQEDIARSGSTARKIIYMYSGNEPSIAEGILGISIDVDTSDLAGLRSDYQKQCVQSPDDPDTLARALLHIADRAEDRLPPTLTEDRDKLERNRQKRRTMVAQTIVPTLRGTLFDSMGKRVTRHLMEQRLIEFELPKATDDQTHTALPDNTKLTPHANALDIFGISNQDQTLTWKDFRTALRARDTLGGSSVQLAIEQAVISAISTAQTDNDQIMESVNQEIFRILVTKQLDYYSGIRVVQVYFIEKLQTTPLGNNSTSTILGFINVAAKYRFIFIEQDSNLSLESFILEPEPAKVQQKVRALIRELLLIEEEARELKLDEIAAIRAYFGADSAHLTTVKELQVKWFGAREKLMAAAQKMMDVDAKSADFAVTRKGWQATLESFRDTSEEINSIVAVQAAENLKTFFKLSS
jgi:TIR domain